mgnify:CR=1 FL=1
MLKKSITLFASALLFVVIGASSSKAQEVNLGVLPYDTKCRKQSNADLSLTVGYEIGETSGELAGFLVACLIGLNDLYCQGGLHRPYPLIFWALALPM